MRSIYYCTLVYTVDCVCSSVRCVYFNGKTFCRCRTANTTEKKEERKLSVCLVTCTHSGFQWSTKVKNIQAKPLQSISKLSVTKAIQKLSTIEAEEASINQMHVVLFDVFLVNSQKAFLWLTKFTATAKHRASSFVSGGRFVNKQNEQCENYLTHLR